MEPTKTVIEMYRIIPTTQSTLVSMVLVILLFIIYIIFIGYIAIIDMKTTPNISIFLDFILDNHEKSIRQFKKYIISVLSDQTDTLLPDTTSTPSTDTSTPPTDTSTSTPTATPSPDTTDSTTDSSTESFVNPNTWKISKIIQSWFQRFLLMIHLRGNKIFVNKTTY